MNVSPVNGKIPYADYFEILGAAGFDAADFMLNDLVFDNSELYQTDSCEYCEAVKRAAHKHGLTIEQTHAPFQYKKWGDKEHFETVVIPRQIRTLEMSALLGAKVAVFHPLNYKPHKGNEEELFRLNMDYFRRLIPYCKEYGVRLGIENMFQRDAKRGCIVVGACNTAEEMIRYIDTLDSEFVGACLDLGHVGLPLRDDEAQDMIRALGHDRLIALHVHDNDYHTDGHLLPYFGHIDWVQITQALADINYGGNLTYEVSSDLLNTTDCGFTPIAAKFIADIGRHLICETERKK